MCPACGYPNNCNATMCENCWWTFFDDCPESPPPPNDHNFPKNETVCDVCQAEPMVRCVQCQHMYYQGGQCDHQNPPVPPT